MIDVTDFKLKDPKIEYTVNIADVLESFFIDPLERRIIDVDIDELKRIFVLNYERDYSRVLGFKYILTLALKDINLNNHMVDALALKDLTLYGVLEICGTILEEKIAKAQKQANAKVIEQTTSKGSVGGATDTTDTTDTTETMDVLSGARFGNNRLNIMRFKEARPGSTDIDVITSALNSLFENYNIEDDSEIQPEDVILNSKAFDGMRSNIITFKNIYGGTDAEVIDEALEHMFSQKTDVDPMVGN